MFKTGSNYNNAIVVSKEEIKKKNPIFLTFVSKNGVYIRNNFDGAYYVLASDAALTISKGNKQISTTEFLPEYEDFESMGEYSQIKYNNDCWDLFFQYTLFLKNNNVI